MSQNKQSNYRVTFILDTRGYQEPVETLVEKLKGVVVAIQGAIREVKNLGVREFTRVASQKFQSGHYVQIDFSGPAAAPAALREKLRLDRTVDRMLIESISL